MTCLLFNIASDGYILWAKTTLNQTQKQIVHLSVLLSCVLFICLCSYMNDLCTAIHGSENCGKVWKFCGSPFFLEKSGKPFNSNGLTFHHEFNEFGNFRNVSLLSVFKAFNVYTKTYKLISL